MSVSQENFLHFRTFPVFIVSLSSHSKSQILSVAYLHAHFTHGFTNSVLRTACASQAEGCRVTFCKISLKHPFRKLNSIPRFYVSYSAPFLKAGSFSVLVM